jgi:uncharacterized repeat protein (TIGR01451 family)
MIRRLRPCARLRAHAAYTLALCALLCFPAFMSARVESNAHGGAKVTKGQRASKSGRAAREPERVPATVDNGPGDGSVAIAVDAYGAFGSSITGPPAAVYDPLGSEPPASTVFDSAIYFSPLDDYLTTSPLGGSTGNLPDIPFTSASPTQLTSSFSVAEFNFALTQSLSPATAAGSVFTQAYSITNTAAAPQTFTIVRYFDGDLLFDGTLVDGGKVSADGTVLSEFDAVGTNAVKSVVSISASGGTQTAFTVQDYAGGAQADRIRTDNGIGPAFVNMINGDANGDRVTDTNYDITLSIESRFMVPGKTASPLPPTQGDSLSYTISVANAGPDVAVGVVVTDLLAAGTTFLSVSSPGTCMAPAVGTAGTVTCTLPDIVAGQTVFVVVTVQVIGTPGTILSNTATVTSSGSADQNPANNSATFSATVVPASPDLSITKVDTQDPVPQDGQLVYTITIFNAGPGTADDVVFTDSTPAGTTFAFLGSSLGSCASLAPGGTGAVSCNLGSVPSGFSVQVTFGLNVIAVAGTTITNTASVSTSSADPDLSNNSATQTTGVSVGAGRADLSITMTDSPDPVAIGSRLVYSIAVGNAGPDPALNVTVFTETPPGTRFVSATPSQGGCTPPLGDVGTLICALGTIPAGGTATITVVLDVLGPEGAELSAVAAVAGSARDLISANNTATISTLVAGRGGGGTGASDLAIVVADVTPSPVSAGGLATYTITVTNLGPDPATGVTVNSTTPAGTTFASLTTSQGSCITPAPGGTGPMSCALGSLTPGGSVTITLVVNVIAASGSTLTYTTSVTSSSADPNPGNNTATQDVGVQATQPPIITGARKLTNPFRVKILGFGFQPGARVFIGSSETSWPDVKYKSPRMLVLRRGGLLQDQFPKGQPTRIRVVNPDGGSDETLFTR